MVHLHLLNLNHADCQVKRRKEMQGRTCLKMNFGIYRKEKQKLQITLLYEQPAHAYLPAGDTTKRVWSFEL